MSLRSLLAGFALGISQVVVAQVAVQAGETPPALQQKQMLVRALIEDEAVVKRIQESGSEEAMRLFASARETYTAALVAIQAGNFQSAENGLNTAMLAVGKARRKVPDPEVLIAKQRMVYKKSLERVQALEQAYRARLENAGHSSADAEAFSSQAIPDLREKAKAYASEGRWGEAIETLDRAEKGGRAILGRLLGSLLSQSGRQFKTLEEEYTDELARNNWIAELIPLAKAQLGATESEAESIDSLVRQNRVALQQSQRLADSKDFEAALASIRLGTDFLQLALSAAGIVGSTRSGN